MYSIYLHKNKTNGKCYVGLTKISLQRRWANGSGYKRCRLFWRAIEKYGWDGFDHIVLAHAETKEDAEDLERFYIALFRSNNPEFGYNLNSGGGINREISEETRQKLTEIARKRAKDPEYKKKISESWKHRVVTEETKQKMSKSITPYKRKVLCVEEGIVYDSVADAARAMNIKRSGITTCCKGRTPTICGFHWVYMDEERLEKSGSMENFLEEVRRDLNEDKPRGSWNFRKVICLDTNIIYDSIKEAAQATKIPSNRISECCSGKHKSTHGLRWAYI